MCIRDSNYTPSQLRDVQDRYAEDQEEWEDAEGGSLNLYIHDILFGGGFIGFNTSVEVEVPSYADGLPSVEGTLDLKVMNNEYTIGCLLYTSFYPQAMIPSHRLSRTMIYRLLTPMCEYCY